MTQIQKITDKLRISNKYLDRDFLQRLIDRFAPSYSVSQLCDVGLISPLKRGATYVNLYNPEVENPYGMMSLYFGDETYMFGGLGVYNLYGLTTQLADWNTVYNTKISGQRIIGNIRYIFSRQRESFFYGKIQKKYGEYLCSIMSPERSVIQMMIEGKNITELPKNIAPKKLLQMAEQFAPKRILQIVKKLCL